MNRIKIKTQLQVDDNVIIEGSNEEMEEKIIELATRLPEHCQHAFYMTTLHGLSDVQTAEFLNCSAQEVRERMDEVVEVLRGSS